MSCYWLLVAVLGGVGCDLEPSDSDGPYDKSENGTPPLVLYNVHLEEYGGDGKKLDLWSKSAKFERGEEKVYLQGVKAFWSSQQSGNGNNGLSVNGQEGYYDLKEEIALIKGDVTLSTADGYTTYTDQVRYDHKKQQIKGAGSVRIEGPEGFTEGTGLLVEMGREVFVIRKEVRTILNPSAIEKATAAGMKSER